MKVFFKDQNLANLVMKTKNHNNRFDEQVIDDIELCLSAVHAAKSFKNLLGLRFPMPFICDHNNSTICLGINSDLTISIRIEKSANDNNSEIALIHGISKPCNKFILGK